MPLASDSSKTILFGDDNGNVYNLNGEGVGDAGTDDIVAQRKLPLQEYSYNMALLGRVFYRKLQECELNIAFEWGDEKNTTDVSMILRGADVAVGNYYNDAAYYNTVDTFYYSEGIGGAGIPSSKSFSVMGKGSNVFVTLEVISSENFEIDYVEV